MLTQWAASACRSKLWTQQADTRRPQRPVYVCRQSKRFTYSHRNKRLVRRVPCLHKKILKLETETKDQISNDEVAVRVPEKLKTKTDWKTLNYLIERHFTDCAKWKHTNLNNTKGRSKCSWAKTTTSAHLSACDEEWMNGVEEDGGGACKRAPGCRWRHAGCAAATLGAFFFFFPLRRTPQLWFIRRQAAALKYDQRFFFYCNSIVI